MLGGNMGYVENNIVWDGFRRKAPPERPRRREPVVLVLEDPARFAPAVQAICSYMGIAMERMDTNQNLAAELRARRPMAVLAALDGATHDGCHVMIAVGEYDRTLPLMLVTGHDLAELGAADAVEEIWRLEEVDRRAQPPEVVDIVEFLFAAGRRGRCLNLMPE
jgi:ActR/RegA family two-component response regulator